MSCCEVVNVSSTSSGKSSDTNWSMLLTHVNWFREAIDYLESEDCASGDLVIEARKKIAEAVELIAAAAGSHDKDKQDRAKSLISEIQQAFFAMLDSCYNKYAGPRVSQMSRGGGKA